MIKTIIKKFLNIFPVKKVILFESVPNLSDNSKAVFDEMIKRGVNQKYKLVWFVDEKFKPTNKIKNVKYLCFNKGILNKIRSKILHYRVKCLISCNSFLPSVVKKQKSFYLAHGMPLKSVRGYYTVPNEIDYCLVTGQGLLETTSYEFNFPQEKLLPLGYPRNDSLVTTKGNNKELFDIDCDKIIVWYPTFRQHVNGKVTAGGNALPIIHDEKLAIQLNEKAKESRVLIVLKPHFAQNLDNVKNLGLSNIIFIDDEFFIKNNISSYEFVARCDALITDYSSIYYDFLLCDKPVALIWEDIEQYKEKPGLIKDYECYSAGAQKIYNIEEFKEFIDNLANGIDKNKEARNQICQNIHASQDGQSSKRVVDFILGCIDKKEF
ncbi:MAG: CDP-glycerol glycerophosphotransferase family protein [Clostridia bacterium]|nr:CDP-glycerol glycerophosphotransferase family protein [Clostridia bacterium]